MVSHAWYLECGREISLNGTLGDIHLISAIFPDRISVTVIPVGNSANGMPMGVQIIPRSFGDLLSLRVAHELEAQLEFNDAQVVSE